jgi:hypothetical protein
MSTDGYDSLEEAGRGGIPDPYVHVLGYRVSGNKAVVWTLTNDRPPFEEDELFLERKGARWFPTYGQGGWSNPPPEVWEKARRLGHRPGWAQAIPHD